MSNKQNQNKQKWLQISNYLIGKEKNSYGEVLCVRAVSGQWSIRWSEDTMVYAVLTRCMADKKCWSYVEALLTLFFAATNYAHDFAALAEGHGTPFMNGFTELINKQSELELSFKKESTPEEEEQALHEVGEMQEIQDELDKLDNGNADEGQEITDVDHHDDGQ